jgi:hypothetical protein
VDEMKDGRPLVATPRHLKRRMFHQDIPDTLLVRVEDPFPWQPTPARVANRQATGVPSSFRAFGRKRAVALLVVILVSLTIPSLLLALILAG